MTERSLRYIDIGVNLTNGRFRKDLSQVIRRAEEAGVEAIIITGTSLTESRKALELVDAYQGKTTVKLFTTVGVHPHDAKGFNTESTVAEMKALVEKYPGAVAAIGECGLDFNRDYSPRDAQKQAFHSQLELACELQLPLFVHEREAHDALRSVLEPFVKSGRLPPLVVHCFTGTAAEMDKYISMGFYIGITGFVCMDGRGHALRTMVSRLPVEKLMVETDAPFMCPYPSHGGRKPRCEPKDVVSVVSTLAECMGTTVEQLSRITTQNANRFFRLQDKRKEAASKTASKKSREQKMQVEEAMKVNGGSGEGGGQVLRISTAVAAVTGQNIHIEQIRSNRPTPGLRNQHIQTLKLVDALTGSGHLRGNTLGSSEVAFEGKYAVCEQKTVRATSATNGSVSLMLQGALPIAFLSTGKEPTKLRLQGGTHVGFSPPIDFMQHPFMTLLDRLGCKADIQVNKRGFFRGRTGDVQVNVEPAPKGFNVVDISTSSRDVVRVFTKVTVHGPTANDTFATHMTEVLEKVYRKQLQVNSQMEWETVVDKVSQSSKRGKQQDKGGRQNDRNEVSVMTMVETQTGGILSADETSKKSPSSIASILSQKLHALLQSGACVDEHLADNAVIYMALANGNSKLKVPGNKHRRSKHLETAITVLKQLTNANIQLTEEASGEAALLEVQGIGLGAK